MKMYPTRRKAIALALTAAGAIGLAAGCLNAPTGGSNPPPPGPLSTGCDPVFQPNSGALYRVQSDGLGLKALATGLNMKTR